MRCMKNGTLTAAAGLFQKLQSFSLPTCFDRKLSRQVDRTKQ